jgi:hypothetical protein
VEPVKEKEQPEDTAAAAEPDRFEISAAGDVILSWTAVGAEAIELKKGSVSLFKSGRHPLPVQYRVSVDRDVFFTLIATGRTRQPSDTDAQPVITQAKTIEIAIVPPRA